MIMIHEEEVFKDPKGNIKYENLENKKDLKAEEYLCLEFENIHSSLPYSCVRLEKVRLK